MLQTPIETNLTTVETIAKLKIEEFDAGALDLISTTWNESANCWQVEFRGAGITFFERVTIYVEPIGAGFRVCRYTCSNY
jgi:hypothetical protein